MSKHRLLLAALPLLALGLACTSEDEHRWRAEIRWTSYGIPHITADDVPSAAYAQGYAFAQDNGCILADQIVKVRSERAAFFGPGDDDANLDSDFTLLHLGIYARSEAAFPEQPEAIQELVSSYASGYNAYLEAHGEDMPCGGEPWVRPISAIDLFAHYIELGTLASGRALADYIATAQPPGAGLVRDDDPMPLSRLRATKPGSNGWGIGAERSSTGGGMLVANPHFPWQGELKLWESHLRVPGELDIYGVGLMGVVGVLIGFNEHVAWTHTVSDGQRFTFYKLTLDPSNPTVYMYDGQPRAMESETYTVDVLQQDGSTKPGSRTMWRSHYGPMLNTPFGWSSEVAISYRDANIGNTELIAQFNGMDAADSLAEFQDVHRRIQGIPWVNTMATSAEGTAWYADSTPTPNLSQASIDAWLDARENDFLTSALAENDVVLLDGSTSMNEWVEEAGAREPGLVPFDKVPQLERADFIYNANDSHWLTNPAQPLVGYSPMHGFERTPRTPRTRMNMTTLTEMGPGSPSGDDAKFDLPELQAAILSNRGKIAELVQAELVARCQGADPVEYFDEDAGTTSTVDITDVCAAIAAWDGRLDIDSAGAVAFREFIGEYPYRVAFVDAGLMFDVPFDPDDPIDTPNTLAAADEDGTDFALGALAGATVRLQRAGIAPTATLREVQYTLKNGERFPMHGGGSAEGITNLIDYDILMTTLEAPVPRGEVINSLTGLTTDGYVVNYGTSFIMTMQFADDGPHAAAFLTYSQSGDPSSPHYSDQTTRFAEKQWRDIVYTEADIDADTQERLTLVGD